MSRKSSNRGITLIALVVSIIVLLILAGISISMLTGNNGILQKTADAKERTDNAQITERIQLAYHSALAGGKGSYTKESLEVELEKEFGQNNYNVNDDSDEEWILFAKVQGKEQSITIPAGEIDLSVDTTWQQAFIFPTYGNYTRYTLDETNKTLTLKSGPPLTTENVEIKKYAIINGIKYNTKFPDSCNALFVNSQMKTLTIDATIDTSNVIDMNRMFLSCDKLSSLKISGFNTCNVTNMEYMFYGCNSLREIDLSNWNTASVKNMGNMFQGCGALEHLNLSQFDTKIVEKMNAMFLGCNSLVSLDLSSFNTNNVTNMAYMFASQTSLESELIESKIKTIYVSNNFVINSVEESEKMFKGCSKLEGGNGTIYDENKIDASMAHIDTGENPGYFTAK